jgi:hypothetical protein
MFVDCESAGLLLVRGIVLDGGSDAVALKAFNILRCELSCKKRIFTERFEVAAPQRMAMNADCGC